MMRWTEDAVRAALGLAAAGPGAPVTSAGEPCGADAVGGVGDVAYHGVSTDTRALESGSLFVALVGERFDAHEFLGQAAERGATAAIVSRIPDDAPADLCYYVVEDTLVALGQLGNYRRRRLAARVCAITGTNGKTTTKELTRAALATRYRVHATSENLNNQVGTPLTLLSAPDDAEVVIAEVGTNSPGEIARLRDIVEPDAAIITGVAEGHLEGLGSVEGVLTEKTALLERLKDTGLALVADMPPELPVRARTLTRRVRVAGMSERADSDLRADDVALDTDGRLSFRWRDHDVNLAFRGRHNASNALLALGLAEAWGVDMERAVAAVAEVQPQKMRGEIHHYGNLVVIADCYNANPPSTRAALDLLVGLPHDGRRIAILGTMLELGAFSAMLHERILAEAIDSEVDLIVATGEFAAAADSYREQAGERLLEFADPVDAFRALVPQLRGDEVVLLKGSRGVALERLMPGLAAVGGEQAEAEAEAEEGKGKGKGKGRGKGKGQESGAREAGVETGREPGRSASASSDRGGR